jgi:hypothetical protein
MPSATAPSSHHAPNRVLAARPMNTAMASMEAADRRSPQATSNDGTRLYKPGIGPFSEDAAVRLTLAEMRATHGDAYAIAGKRRYPSGRSECDLALGELPEWAIEVKMGRLGRDNGTYEDTTTKKILSPYPDDRSAVTDCRKLASSGFAGRRAVLIYGFNDPKRPIMRLIEAFEFIAARDVTLGPREEAHSVTWFIPYSQRATSGPGRF